MDTLTEIKILTCLYKRDLAKQETNLTQLQKETGISYSAILENAKQLWLKQLIILQSVGRVKKIMLAEKGRAVALYLLRIERITYSKIKDMEEEL